MSATYRINFRQLRQETLRTTFASIDRACAALSLDIYLIGALARDTWFAAKGIRALGTKDIDLAVLVPHQSDYQRLKEYLVKQETFTQTNNPYTLKDTNGLEVDLLPFGALEIEGRRVTDAAGNIRYDVTGLQEVYEHATEEVEFENAHVFRVSSLAGIVILKLIAWEDRPEMRSKDLSDIALIVKHYYELEETLIFEHHADLFATDPGDLDLLGARALGREIGKVLRSNADVRIRIERILTQNRRTISSQFSSANTGPDTPFPIDYQDMVLTSIMRGINE